MLPSKVKFDTGLNIKLNYAAIKCVLLTKEKNTKCTIDVGRESVLTSPEAHQAAAYPVFCVTSIISIPPLDEMLVHHRVTPSIKFASTHLCTWAEKGTERVTSLVSCPRTHCNDPTQCLHPDCSIWRRPH